jgi:hypothetical protein
MLCTSLAGKFKSGRKWATTGIYDKNKQSHISSFTVSCFYYSLWGESIYLVIFTLAKFLCEKSQRQLHAKFTTVLALATLGSSAQIGSFLLAKASTVVTVACCCCWCFCVQTSPMYTSLNMQSLASSIPPYLWFWAPNLK